MDKYIPNMYQRSIFDINYRKLKEKGIKCIIFDLDNTLLLVKENVPNKKVCYLIKKLKKDFNIYIMSNNSSKKRLNKAASMLKIPYISFAMKPLSFGFNKIMKKHNYKSQEMCMIGDQLMTDILGGNRANVFTVLVDALSKEELKLTSFNRFLEKRKLRKLENLGMFKKGDFYE